MTDLRRSAALLLLGLLAGCARVIAPGGGPEDKIPPVLLGSTPDSGAVNISRTDRIELRFSEWIDPASVKGALSLMPAPSRSPLIEADGPVVWLRLREPLDSASTVILRLGSGISDFRKAPITTAREIPFSTGPALDSGKLRLRMWMGYDSAAPTVFRGKVGLYSLDSARRQGLSRLLRRRDSVAWLAAPPSPWREKAWRWAQADSQGVVKLSHLPPGRWRVVAWDDKDKDGYWRSGEESFGWAGDIVWTGAALDTSFLARLSPLDTVTVARPTDTAKTDSVAKPRSRRARDSAKAPSPEEIAAKRIADSLEMRKDSLFRRDSVQLDSLAVVEANLPDDSSRVIVLDSLPASFAGKALAARLYRMDSRRRPVTMKPGPRGLEARVPRGGKWGGELWVDLDGDGRLRIGDPFRGIEAEPWMPLAVVADDVSKEELLLRMAPQTLPPDGAPQ